ncbi:hypothetical protein BDR06DRAFT_975527 [Suillus hirtellus]|nr:hypothetical protein BDR06DRAFT_975527 [Suillus hirtellus]
MTHQQGGLRLGNHRKIIARGRKDGSVQRWTTDEKMIEGVWTDHSNGCGRSGGHPEEVISPAGPKTERFLLDSRSGELLHSLEHNNFLYSVALSPKDNGISWRVYVVTHRQLSRSVISTRWLQWEEPSLKHEFEGHKEAIWGFVFLHDNIHIVSGSVDGTICKWNCDTGLVVGEPWKGEGGSNSRAMTSNSAQFIHSFSATHRMEEIASEHR